MPAHRPLVSEPVRMPAQELSEAGQYLAGAFGVFLLLLLLYVAIMASKLSSMERELGELNELADREPREMDPGVEREGHEVAREIVK